MKTLDKIFSRKGIQYETFERTDKVGFFKLTLDGEHIGYEVSRIHQHEPYEIAGVTVEAGENIVGDEAFGADGSKSFFPSDEEYALAYFEDFCKEVAEKDAEKAEITSI